MVFEDSVNKEIMWSATTVDGNTKFQKIQNTQYVEGGKIRIFQRMRI